MADQMVREPHCQLSTLDPEEALGRLTPRAQD